MQPDRSVPQTYPMTINGRTWKVRANIRCDMVNMGIVIPDESEIVFSHDAAPDVIEGLFGTAFRLSTEGAAPATFWCPDLPPAAAPPSNPQLTAGAVTVVVEGQAWTVRPDILGAANDGALILPATRELLWTDGLDRDAVKDALYAWFGLATKPAAGGDTDAHP